MKNIGVVSLLTVASRVLGVVRDSLAVAIFGTGEVLSTYYTAYRLPNLFRRLLGEGSLTAAFLPTLQEELHERGKTGAFALLNQVTSWLLLVTCGLAGTAMLICSQARHWATLSPELGDVADLSVLLFPYLVLVCIAAAFNATLNVFRRFTEPALSPIWLNLAMIVSLGGAGLHWAHTPAGQIRWLCAGVLAGGFFQMAVPAGVLMRDGWRPRFDLTLSPKVKEIARLMIPGFFGTAIYQVNILVAGFLALAVDDSAPTHLFNANRLMELPIGVFAITVTTVVYPLLARHALERKFQEMATDFHRGIRLILAINIPAAVGLALLSEPIIRLIYQHGAFKAADTAAMAPLLRLFAIGLPFFSITNLTVRAFYAVKDTTTPVKVGLIDFAINLALSVTLMGWLGASGLVLASTTAIIVQTLLLHRALVRKLPAMHLAPLWPSVGKVLIATLVMGGAVWGGWQGLTALLPGRHLADLLALGGLIPLAVAGYAGMLWVLRIEGREEIVATISRRWKPKNETQN